MRNVRLDCMDLMTGSFEEAADWLTDLASTSSSEASIVAHMNARNYHFLLKEPDLIRALSSDAVMILDGIGIKVAAWLLGKGWLPDLNGTDLFPKVMSRAAGKGLKVFLLGGTDSVVARAAENTARKYPGLVICGNAGGYFREEDEPEIARKIGAHSPDILLIGMGFPRQEYFSLRWRGELRARLVWNVGGLFDFVSLEKPRAPVIIRRLRLEWLFRWIVEPARLFRRTFYYEPLSVIRLVARGSRSERKSEE